MISLLCLMTTVLSGCLETEHITSVNREDALIVFTSHPSDIQNAVFKQFEREYGIHVEAHSGGSKEMLEEFALLTESGEVDIMFGGGIELLESYKGYFEPYYSKHTRSLQSRYRSKKGEWTPFTVLPIVIAYNTDLVSPEEAPSSWSDLLVEKWRGEIIFASPISSGTSYAILSGLEQLFGEDRDVFMPKFAAQLRGKETAGTSSVLTKLKNKDGKIAICLEQMALKEMAAGSHIDIVYPTEGVICVPDGVAIAKHAPHLENAQKFVDFCVSRDMQQVLSEQYFRRSIRKDLEGNGDYPRVYLLPFDIWQAGKEEDSFVYEWEWELEKHN